MSDANTSTNTGATTAADEWGAVADAWETRIGWIEDHNRVPTDAMIDALAIRAGDQLVEFAAGPGALTGEWVRRVGPHGTVLLTDVSPAMVAAAAKQAARYTNVSAAVADLADLDLPHGAFDAAACRHGLMFAPEPQVALANVAATLAPGGRLAALVWGPLDRNPWLTCVGMSAMMHGVATGGPPVAPGQIFSLGDAERLAGLARDAGFVDVSVTEQPVVMPSDSAAEHVDRVLSFAGPLAAAFAQATPEQQAAVRATAAELAAPYADGDGRVAIPGLSLLLSARTA